MAGKSIIFVCVGNACRSQMAEGFARHYAPQDVKVFSTGSHPAGFVAPEAIRAMAEQGIDISAHWSKHIDELPGRKFDYVVTMGCGDACPAVPAIERIDWQIPDPIGRGPEYFRSVRDLIEEKVKKLLEKITD